MASIVTSISGSSWMVASSGFSTSRSTGVNSDTNNVRSQVRLVALHWAMQAPIAQACSAAAAHGSGLTVQVWLVSWSAFINPQLAESIVNVLLGSARSKLVMLGSTSPQPNSGTASARAMSERMISKPPGEGPHRSIRARRRGGAIVAV